jgi:hypothetical protein
MSYGTLICETTKQDSFRAALMGKMVGGSVPQNDRFLRHMSHALFVFYFPY